MLLREKFCTNRGKIFRVVCPCLAQTIGCGRTDIKPEEIQCMARDSRGGLGTRGRGGCGGGGNPPLRAWRTRAGWEPGAGWEPAPTGVAKRASFKIMPMFLPVRVKEKAAHPLRREESDDVATRDGYASLLSKLLSFCKRPRSYPLATACARLRTRSFSKIACTSRLMTPMPQASRVLIS
ncbi:MAG: hypothetical protein KatS3mg056_3279 [Chloroflexus sp.]|nr:MAG: hypothetical protein KatS3mg056_3279 [Chloroflexus sp.]